MTTPVSKASPSPQDLLNLINLLQADQAHQKTESLATMSSASTHSSSSSLIDNINAKAGIVPTHRPLSINIPDSSAPGTSPLAFLSSTTASGEKEALLKIAPKNYSEVVDLFSTPKTKKYFLQDLSKLDPTWPAYHFIENTRFFLEREMARLEDTYSCIGLSKLYLKHDLETIDERLSEFYKAQETLFSLQEQKAQKLNTAFSFPNLFKGQPIIIPKGSRTFIREYDFVKEFYANKLPSNSNILKTAEKEKHELSYQEVVFPALYDHYTVLVVLIPSIREAEFDSLISFYNDYFALLKKTADYLNARIEALSMN